MRHQIQEKVNLFSNDNSNLYNTTNNTEVNINVSTEENISTASSKKTLKSKIIDRYGFDDKNKFSKNEINLFFGLIVVLPIVLSVILSFIVPNNLYSILYLVIKELAALVCFIIFISFQRKDLKFYRDYKYLFFLVPAKSVLMFALNTIFGIFIYRSIPGADELDFSIAMQLISSIFDIGIVVLFLIATKVFKDWIKKAFSIKNLWITFLIVVVGFFVFYGLQFGLSQLPKLINPHSSGSSNNQSSLQRLTSTNFGIFVLFVSAVIVAPIFEEIFYRYYISYFSNHSIIGYLLSTIYFAFLHVGSSGDFIQIFPYFALGIVNGFIYYFFRNLTPCISIHFIGNLVAFILMVISTR